MLTYRTGAARTPSAAKAIVSHFLSPTLPLVDAMLASYYQRGLSPTGAEAESLGTFPEVRRDINPRLEKLLGLSPTRPPTEAELANLLAGRRADALRIPGKQIQESTVSLADELGLRPDRLPLAHEIMNIVSGAQADGGEKLPPHRADVLRCRLLGMYGLNSANQAINSTALESILAGRRADGSAISFGPFFRSLTSTKAQISFIDLCWSADKSVSLCWALAPTEAERNLIALAHKEAVASAMRHVEKVIGNVRKGKAGSGGADSGSIAWIAFDHYTARPTVKASAGEAVTSGKSENEVKCEGDPQLHTHVTTLGVALTESGRVGALDLGRLRGRVHELGHIYQAFLATNLRKLGIDVRLDEMTGAARISAIPLELIKEFSKRTETGAQSARAYARDYGLDWNQLNDAQKIGLLKRGVQGDPRQAKKDDVGARARWLERAAEANWVPQSVLRLGDPIPLNSRGQRIETAYQNGLKILERRLVGRAVLDGALLRAAAAAGFVAAGLDEIDEIDAVVDLFLTRGVLQDGAITQLIPGYGSDHRSDKLFKVTTAMHVTREEELVQLARVNSKNMSGALNRRQLDQAIEGLAIDFEASEHQRAQRAVMERLAFGGRLSVAIGVAGSGKTTMMSPLVRAWRNHGRTVWGAAIAWRQASDLAAAGIDEDRCLALSVFTDRVKKGLIKVDRDSALIIDELGTVPTALLLEVLRLQSKHEFRIVAVGDPRQCASIEAGPVVDILQRALGADAIPELLSTIRQKTEAERKTTLLFREGRAAEALFEKRSNNTARLISGDYESVVLGVAMLWKQRVDLNQGDNDWSISVSAPTNRDARAISAAIRRCRQSTGEIGPDMWSLSCCDLQGDQFDINLALGDRVRLFKRVNACCSDGIRGLIGNNGSVLEVVAVKGDGITLRNKKGRVGHVLWDTLRSENGRILLSYGDVLTIDSSQGVTSSEHIEAIPAGSASLNSFKAYTASSRHRSATYIIASESAERQEITKRRPIGDTRRISESDIWDNIARNLSRIPEAGGALAFLEHAHRAQREAAVSMLVGLQCLEESKGQKGLSNRFQRHRASRCISGILDLLRGSVERMSRFTKLLVDDLAPSSVSENGGDRASESRRRQFDRAFGPAYRM